VQRNVLYIWIFFSQKNYMAYQEMEGVGATHLADIDYGEGQIGRPFCILSCGHSFPRLDSWSLKIDHVGINT
jgi:hypothetical protein